jgi:hypothetical protein
MNCSKKLKQFLSIKADNHIIFKIIEKGYLLLFVLNIPAPNLLIPLKSTLSHLIFLPLLKRAKPNKNGRQLISIQCGSAIH